MQTNNTRTMREILGYRSASFTSAYKPSRPNLSSRAQMTACSRFPTYNFPKISETGFCNDAAQTHQPISRSVRNLSYEEPFLVRSQINSIREQAPSRLGPKASGLLD